MDPKAAYTVQQAQQPLHNMTHPLPIFPDAVTDARVSHYTLWEGEVLVTVTQHLGAYGFYSAAMVVERMDSPIECMLYEGYSGDTPKHLGKLVMRNWIAAKLNMLATGTHSATGDYSEIVKGSDAAIIGTV